MSAMTVRVNGALMPEATRQLHQKPQTRVMRVTRSYWSYDEQ